MNKRNAPIRVDQNDSFDMSNLPPVRSRTRSSKPFADGEPGIATNDNIPSCPGKPSQAKRQATKWEARGAPQIVSGSTEQEATKTFVAKQTDYSVGYGKPPVHTRFKKGQSGNPKGRATGTRNLQSLYLEERDAKVTVTENGQRRIVTKGAIAIKTLFSNVAKGQPKAFDQVLKLENLVEAEVDGGSKGNGEALPSQPLAERNAELLDTYFAKRLAALNVGERAMLEGAERGVKRPKTRRSPSMPSQTKLPKLPIQVNKNEGEKGDGRIPVLLSQTPPSSRTLPLRAIKDD